VQVIIAPVPKPVSGKREARFCRTSGQPEGNLETDWYWVSRSVSPETRSATAFWGVFRNPWSPPSPKLLHLRARSTSSRAFRKELLTLRQGESSDPAAALVCARRWNQTRTHERSFAKSHRSRTRTRMGVHAEGPHEWHMAPSAPGSYWPAICVCCLRHLIRR
jgi:hypothetical protein